MNYKKIAFIFLALGIIGFFDAGYLTLKHYTHTPIGCSLVQGCERVTTSEYAVVGGVPVALLGTLYYFIIALFSGIYLKTKNKKWIRAEIIITPIGFAASVWFVYAQLFIIGAICLYCIGSVFISTALFVVSMVNFKQKTYFFPSA